MKRGHRDSNPEEIVSREEMERSREQPTIHPSKMAVDQLSWMRTTCLNVSFKMLYISAAAVKLFTDNESAVLHDTPVNP